MKADIVKLLLESHLVGDDSTFRKAALQLAASESAAGHSRVAEEIRALVAEMPTGQARPASQVVNIAQPRGELGDLLEGSHREERLRDIVLGEDTRKTLLRLLEENRSRARLEKFGVGPRRRVLLYGPPGCGKTLTAEVVAGEMGVPLMTVRLDTLFSRFLGATGAQLRVVFSEMSRRPGVYLFDEFDAIAKSRGDTQDVGEMNRVVTTFLQLVDADVSGSIIVAATNHLELLDRAVYRRFDAIVALPKPNAEQIAGLLTLRLRRLGLTLPAANSVGASAEGNSFADVARACDDAIRTMVLQGREQVQQGDLVSAFRELSLRPTPARSGS